jgi:hypothetical protein
MKFEALLSGTVRVFWATTYSFDLKLFDQYLLRRLGQSALNAVVLVDQDKLSSVWDHLHQDQTYLTKQAGRRYLLRGIAVPGGGAFHAKTYLVVRGEEATLVVGSGNLTRSGIDDGRETFTRFSSAREDDLPSMRAWGQWMSAIVEQHGDGLLRERWSALRRACPWILGSSTGTRFLSNATRPLLDQVVERLPADVAELHVTTPFFDRHAIALARLLNMSSPRTLRVYLGAGVSVHGPSLATVLRSVEEVSLSRFAPARFVHAKLIGSVAANGTGLVVSGSANLSHAALTLHQAQPGGNSEVAVVRSGTADDVRNVFQRSGLTLVEESLDWLDGLEFSDDHPGVARPLVLRSARWRDDGHVALDVEGIPAGAIADWDGATAGSPIESDGVSTDRLDTADTIPRVIWLVDTDRLQLSNAVVVDDPAALQEALAGRASSRSSRPTELAGMDMAPLVRLALWAHELLIFDPDETDAFRRAQEAAAEDANAEDPGDFWERYVREELQYDPRVQAYKPLTVSSTEVRPVDEMLRELETLLHAAPGAGAAGVLRVLTVVDDDAVAGTPWTMEARQRVRAYHLLMRRSAAISDPRHALVSANAPVVNYETLLALVVMAWVNDALGVVQLRKLLLTLLQAFVGPASGLGYLGQLDHDDRDAARIALDPRLAEIAAGLAFVALREPGWREDIYDWQPVIKRGRDLGVVAVGPLSSPVVLHATGASAELDDIEALLVQRIDWIDDDTWCARLSAELGLTSFRLEPHSPPVVPLAAKVTGIAQPVRDTRLLTVARRLLDFKHLQAVAVRAGDDTFVFEPGARARAKVGSQVYQTDDVVDSNRVHEIENQGGSWADLLGLGPEIAAA